MNKINLNDDVWAELNENGWKHLESYYEKLFWNSYGFAKSAFSVSDYVDMHKKATAPHVVDGVERMLTRFHLHDFMLKFGDKCYVGTDNFVVENNVYFDLEARKSVLCRMRWLKKHIKL